MHEPEFRFVDSRPAWMIEEDNFMLCWTRCSLFRYCASRFGSECKRLGGDEIPKIRYG
ncbi:hypothetical protein PHGAL3_0015 [Phage Altai3]|nr:hypothetical protein PHGAL3_0015 [Phage Altai3]